MSSSSKRQPITIPVPIETDEYGALLADIVSRCRAFDPVQLLTGLAWLDLAVPCTNDRSPVILEFAHQLVLSAGMPGSRPPDPDDLADIRSSLERVIMGPPSDWLEVDVTNARENLLRSVGRDEQTVRGKAAPYHQIPYIHGLFKLVDDWLDTEFGITSGDVNATLHWLYLSFQQRVIGIGKEALENPISKRTLLSVFEQDLFLLEDPPPRVLTVLNLLTAAPCSHTTAEVSLPGQARLLPRDFPVLEIGQKLYCFNLQPVIDELPALLDGWLKTKNQKRYTSFVKAREKHATELALSYFSRAFPGCRIGQNLFYTPPGEERCEVDGLILYDDIAIVVEAKGAQLTQKARSGHGRRLERDYEKLVADSLRQGLRVGDFVEKDNERMFTDNAGNPVLNLSSKPSTTYVVNLVLDNIDPLAVGLREARECGLLPESCAWPWAVTLADLNTVTSVLDSPSVLLLYMNRRQKFNELKWLAVHDEIDLLGYYLDHGMPLDGAPRNTDLFLYQYDPTPLWAYIARELTGKLDCQKPFPPFNSVLMDLVSTIEESHCPGALRVSIELLGSRPKVHKELAVVLPTMASRLKDRNGRPQSVNISIGDTAGLSLWFGGAYSPINDQKKILKEDSAHKYERKMDEWLSAVFEVTGNTFRLVDLMVDARPWIHDPCQEKKTQELRELKINLRSAERRIGRNEVCPCGSGKKYKKCHGK